MLSSHRMRRPGSVSAGVPVERHNYSALRAQEVGPKVPRGGAGGDLGLVEQRLAVLGERSEADFGYRECDDPGDEVRRGGTS
jgi:hypothetical protein